MTSAEPTRAGTVSIIGRPNAGKSTLMNRFLGQKLSIVTPRAQTTRRKILGVDTRGGAQIVFFDTPGLLETRYLLQETMLEEARSTINDADVCLLVVDPTREPMDPGPEILETLRRRREALVVVINKLDLLSEHARRTAMDAVRDWFGSDVPIRLVSAETGEGVELLREGLVERLPESPYLYPEDDVSDLPVRFFVAELIREAAFELFADEIPYSMAVMVDEFREGGDPIYIGATIFVERSSQKGIVIGQGGAKIKELGAEARRRIEAFIDARVYLDLWVKVLPKWRKKASALRRLGYPVPDRMNH